MSQKAIRVFGWICWLILISTCSNRPSAQTELLKQTDSRSVRQHIETPSTVVSVPTTSSSTSIDINDETDSDPYHQGYNTGYDDGYNDGLCKSHYATYDDSCPYENDEARLYKRGYESGYDDGYPDGLEEETEAQTTEE